MKKKKLSEMSWEELGEAIREAKKDPQWVREMKEFIHYTTS
jgi:hypothetical protein